jgi:hypothetical protein
LHNSKDIPNNGEVNLNNNNTLETIAHLVKGNKGLSDSVNNNNNKHLYSAQTKTVLGALQ